MSGKAHNIAALMGTLGATAAAKKIVDATWRASARGKKPPTDPADPEITFGEALLFAVLSGAAISVARMLIARRLARQERREALVNKAAGR